MTRLLITGAGGFVGSHVLESALKLTDWDIVCVDSFSHNGITDRIAAAAAEHPPERFTVVRHDMRARMSPEMLRYFGHLDYIVNTASLCQVDQSIREPASFIANNTEVVLTALELARAGCEKFLHMSTDEVYGTGEPRCASDHRPSSPYAASKAAQEDICRSYAVTYGVPVTILNSANLFGERQSQLAFVPKVIRSLLAGEKLRVHVSGGVPARRRYTYVRNVTDLIVTSLPAPMPGRIALPGQEHIDILFLAQRIAALAGQTLAYETVEGAADRPGFDFGYARLDGAWSPAVPFEEGLSRTVAWGTSHPAWMGL